MKRVLLLTSLAAIVAACNLSQDLGGGTETDGGAEASSGSSGTSGSSGASGSSGTSGNTDAGKDAAVLPACPAVAGYLQAPYLKYTFTGGTFTTIDGGARDTSTMKPGPRKPYVLAGHWVSTTADQTDYAGHYLVNANQPSQEVNGQFQGPSWAFAILTEETSNYLTTGATYPITIRYAGYTGVAGQPSSGDDSPGGVPLTVVEDKTWRYPGTGPGSCTLTVDFAQGGPGIRSCLNARFSCTGLVGKGSGATFDVVDGKLSFASGIN